MSTDKESDEGSGSTSIAGQAFLNPPELDALLHMVLALAGEVASLRARLDTHERLNEAAGGWGNTEVDAYVPSAEIARQRAALTDELVAQVTSPIKMIFPGDDHDR
ncbi:MAG: hypothetical protein EA417_19620 [Gammaproteobacteria bacterium]|nr:MAG: hypothetical protein EA417_19620 [Gammaproteobacteria bacterium]